MVEMIVPLGYKSKHYGSYYQRWTIDHFRWLLAEGLNDMHYDISCGLSVHKPFLEMSSILVQIMKLPDKLSYPIIRYSREYDIL
jgi:hypothetical protein